MKPMAPNPTTAALKFSPSFFLESVITDPSATTISSPLTAEERFPFFTPEPCVAVVILPATEICGREARLCRANPFLSRYGASSPYFIPPSTVTVLLTVSRDKILFRLLDETRLNLLSAIELKQCLVPSPRSFSDFLTSDCTSETVFG